MTAEHHADEADQEAHQLWNELEKNKNPERDCKAMNKLQQTLNFTLKMQVLIVFLFIKKEKKSTEKFFQKASRHKKKFLFAPAADICHALVFAAAPLYF